MNRDGMKVGALIGALVAMQPLRDRSVMEKRPLSKPATERKPKAKTPHNVTRARRLAKAKRRSGT